MKSPRFDTRAAPLRQIFSAQNLERIWKDKVRVAMRAQFLQDGIEHFDFHVFRRIECKKLSQLILDGSYVPERPQRILVEKSKGLCRQLVIPAAKDALVLQCLSDALYQQIRNKAPTNRAFFEPKEHRFSAKRGGYGTFASWLRFQKELFGFSTTRRFVVVTDIANYYDSISYTHLRNVISSVTGADESVLDMLIFVLSDLLWQPDYMPRVEIGLPQINLDAPRLLAHCFLYELDKFLASDTSRDFVRFMDDIDIGVDSVQEAKRVLKCVDLVLQTKQIRLNSGKTLILPQAEALHHFRIRENAKLDILRNRIVRKRKDGNNTNLERRLIELRIRRGLSRRSFDEGNGEKILKRWIGLAGMLGARVQRRDLLHLLTLRPAMRENVCAYIRGADLTASRCEILASAAQSGYFTDDASMVDLANHLVETAVTTTSGFRSHIATIIEACDGSYFGLYCRLWLQSKYENTLTLLTTIGSTIELWGADDRLGRIVGAFAPLFENTRERDTYTRLIADTHNAGASRAYRFHRHLASDRRIFDSMYDALRNPNPSRGTGITHPKFLCLLSALRNTNVTAAQRRELKEKNAAVWRDIYYRRIGQRLGVFEKKAAKKGPAPETEGPRHPSQ